jgi:hypothetical protein
MSDGPTQAPLVAPSPQPSAAKDAAGGTTKSK